MAINMFKIRKWGAFVTVGFASVITFLIGMNYYGLFGGIGFFMASLLISLPIANLMIVNPFTELIEGKGILAIDLNSTGVLRPFIVSLDNPFIRGKIANQKIEDVFDREIVGQMAKPIKADKSAKFTKDENGNSVLKLELNTDLFNNARMALFHYPVLIYNSYLKSFITKDFLSEFEKDTQADHVSLYLSRKLEELTSVVRDFGRYVVELTKPTQNFFQSKLGIFVIILAVILIIILLGPMILQSFQNAGAADAVGSAVSNMKGAVGK